MRKADFAKFRRGQVWYVEEENPTPISERNRTSVQAKSRPWLIVSTDKSNQHAYILNCVPISSSSSKDFIAHVVFRNDRGEQNVIECEQITTKGIEDFLHRGTYKYTLSDEIMQVVSEKLASQLDINIQIPNMDYIVKIIERLAEKKRESIKASYQYSVDNAVVELGIKLEELFDIRASEDISLPAKSLEKVSEVIIDEKLSMATAEDILPQVVKEHQHSKQQRPYNSKRYTKNSKRHSSNRRWSDEEKKQFLIDKDSMSIDAMCKKYNITPNAVSGNAYAFRKYFDKKK